MTLILRKKRLGKKIIIGVLSFAAVIAMVFVVYISYGSGVRKNYVIDHLESKGYSQSQMHEIKTKYSFLSLLYGYQPWTASVEFADELGIIYYYNFNSKMGVSQGSFSGDDLVYRILEKEELLERLKHLER